MDVNQLKSFVAVAHLGNLTQAAETLHLSQPAVTAQIKAIERNLNTVLFYRKAQGMSLTPAGEALLARAEDVLQNMHELDVYAMALAQNYVAEAAIGMVDPVTRAKAAHTCEIFLKQLPQVMLHVRHGVSDEILDAVRKKELHGGFFVGHNPYRNVYSVLLETVRYVLIAPLDLLPAIAPDDGKTLNRLPWLDMPDYAAGSKITREFWRKHKILPKSILTCDKIATSVALCAAGLGLALVPQDFAYTAIAEELPIAIIPEFGLDEELSFIYANEFEKDFKTQALLAAVKAVWDC
ncbi:MAG: LysR family transcriptional regulator [Neisseria sp.]|nr:LysR family transcriptional regulator [Neisseria sp.]